MTIKRENEKRRKCIRALFVEPYADSPTRLEEKNRQKRREGGGGGGASPPPPRSKKADADDAAAKLIVPPRRRPSVVDRDRLQFACQDCQARLVGWRAAKAHLREHKGVTLARAASEAAAAAVRRRALYTCKLCRLAFDNYAQLLWHTNNHQSRPGSVCNTCRMRVAGGIVAHNRMAHHGPRPRGGKAAAAVSDLFNEA